MKVVRKPVRRKGAKPSAVPVPVAEETFGGRLRRLRTEAGLSIAEFAERTKYSKGYISKIETGAKPPNPELARCCDEALEASGALAELAPAEATDGPAEAVAAVAAGMAVENASIETAAAAHATEPVEGDAGPATPVGPVDLAEPARVTLAEAFAQEPADTSPHIPAQNAGPTWPPEPPAVTVTVPPVETEPDGPFAAWAPRPEPEESSAESLLSISDPTREDATVPSAGHEETTTKPPAAAVATAPVSGESPTAESADLPGAGKALAVRDGSAPEPAPAVAVAVAVVPSQRRRLILAGLAVLLVAVAVAGAFLLLHLAGDEHPPTDGRVQPAVPAQQHQE